MSSKNDPGYFYSEFANTSSTSANSMTNSTAKVPVPLVVNSISSSSTVTTTTMKSPTTLNNNKKHNLGYRIRHFLFPQLRTNASTATLVRHKSNKDIESTESQQNFPKHNGSYSTFSSDITDHRSSSKRKHTRSKALQTDTTVDYPVPVSNKPSLSSNDLYDCPICMLEQPISQYPELSTCEHRACITCLRQYLSIEIYESRVNITCPECSELLHPNDIKFILLNQSVLIEKYESFMVRRTLIIDPDARWCPAPDCGYCVIATGCASCPMLKCERPGCDTLFCYHCKQEWHPNQTCDQARAQRGFHGRPQSRPGVSFGIRTTDSSTQASTSVDQPLQPDDVKPCPCCKVLIIKMDDGSCNHMTCSVCGTEFCWLCMQKISDLHYLSPSGCTFWGKKPWSRKKKILWQLGMLAGAPVGIALIAGIAVPAIIIGMPVWVGRKLYARFERNRISRHKSSFLVTTGVLTSILVSPILAAVAVGIGVPILLAYIYGVVPISLCRSGGCGAITSSGVRIDLDDDEISTNIAPDVVSVDTAISGRGIANPSIGEASLGMSTSLSIGSSTHLDRAVLDIQADRESSSNVGCAGSITSNIMNNGSAHNSSLGHKLETQVDINSNKRFSFSSQNADATSVSLSLGDRSINTNASVDDASMRVQAGSIRDAVSQCSNANSLSPVDVHVNIFNETIDNSADKSTKKSLENSPQLVHFVPIKFESRSLEYLNSNYCNICHKSHKPCCPNFQHPSKQNGNAIKIKIPVESNKTIIDSDKKSSSSKRENIPKQNKEHSMPKRSSSQVFSTTTTTFNQQKSTNFKLTSEDISKAGLSYSHSFTMGSAIS